jgi:hypothetical protein
MVVFIFVVDDVSMLVTDGVMVLFVFVVRDVVMILTGVRPAVPWWCLPS